MMLKKSDMDCDSANNDCKKIGCGVKFERIRRITGYLVGDVNRFNNAKRRELNDRIIHVGKDAGKLPQRI